MSSLQLGLAVVGGLILGGLIAYNSWQTRRNKPRQAWADGDDTASEASVRLEPRLDDAALVPNGDGAESVLVRDAQEPSFSSSGAEKYLPLDALIDVIAPIALDGRVVSGDAVLAALPATRRVGSKPFAIEGQAEDSRDWEFPVPGRRYRALQAGVQLANRTGPLNDIEFSEFVVKTQRFADVVGGAPEFPEMRDEVARARELDQFAGEHDAQLGFTLRARGAAWSPGFLTQHAGRLGFIAGSVPGRMVLPASQPGQSPLLSIGFDAAAALSDDASHAAIHELALHLDVPQVARSERPFERLCEVVQALAEAMDGAITDDAGQQLRPEVFESIRSDLEHLYDTLEHYDLAAGSPQARRLFS